MTNQEFRAFYDQEYGLVYYWLLSKTHNKAVAQDVASQAFLRAWEKRKTLRETSKSHAWVMTIAHHELTNHWRAHNRRRYEPIEKALEVPDSKDFIHELSEYMECQRAMNAALLLDSMGRRAIYKAVQGVPQQGTAGSRLFKARRELRELCAA